MRNERIKKAEQLFEKKGPILRAKILSKHKFCSKDVAELLTKGYIQRIKTGYYIWASTANQISEIEFAASIIPNGIVCLFSAAQFYEMTTVNPSSINIAVPAPGNSLTLPSYPPITLYKCAQNIYEIGITEVKAPSYKIKIYDKERTVCDFFRMRLQFGEDVALEVLRNYMAGKKNIQKLYEYAGKMRIKGTLSPYVEALL
jgi:predicted transcriptional regulator of viral defense system